MVPIFAEKSWKKKHLSRFCWIKMELGWNWCSWEYQWKWELPVSNINITLMSFRFLLILYLWHICYLTCRVANQEKHPKINT